MTVNTWTPGRVVEAIERGQRLPRDWREILESSGYTVPPIQEPLTARPRNENYAEPHTQGKQ